MQARGGGDEVLYIKKRAALLRWMARKGADDDDDGGDDAVGNGRGMNGVQCKLHGGMHIGEQKERELCVGGLHRRCIDGTMAAEVAGL